MMFKRTPLKRYRGFGRTKFGNIITEYGGAIYDSRAEANYGMWLDSEKRKGRITSWKRQAHVPLVVNKRRICEVIWDFEVEFSDGHREFQEVKGHRTAVFILKEKLFRALYPNTRLVIIKSQGWS